MPASGRLAQAIASATKAWTASVRMAYAVAFASYGFMLLAANQGCTHIGGGSSFTPPLQATCPPGLPTLLGKIGSLGAGLGNTAFGPIPLLVIPLMFSLMLLPVVWPMHSLTMRKLGPEMTKARKWSLRAFVFVLCLLVFALPSAEV